MLVTLTEVNQQSDVIQPRDQDRNRDPKYFWRMTVTDPSGNPHAIFVSGLATDRGRDYHAMIGQQFECQFSGGSVDDRDGSSWKKAKLDKPGSTGGAGRSQGGGAARSQGGGGQGSHPGRRRYEMPRDDYFRRCAILFFESADAHLRRLAEWKAENPELAVNEERFWEQVGKITNQSIMSIGLDCLPGTAEQMRAAGEASKTKDEQAEQEAKEKAEREAAEKREREEKEAREKLEREQAAKAQEMNW